MDVINEEFIDQSADTADRPRSPTRFKAFISYRHVEPDKTYARWLESALETYPVPKPMVRMYGLPAKLGRMFRDEEELAASADLSASIEDALRASEYLIVVCSPRAAASQWVNAEIDFFRKLGRADRILSLLIEGEPSDAFPSSLYDIRLRTATPDAVFLAGAAEPLAADVRPLPGESKRARRRTALIRLAATLLNCRFDDLRQRDQERHQQQMLRYLAVAIVSVFLFMGLSIYAWIKRNSAVKAEEKAFSRELAANAALLPKEDPELNLRLALEAWRVAPTEQAEFSLRNAMVDYNDSHLRAVFEHTKTVRWATFDPTGGRIATASEDGNAALWSVGGGQPLRSFISGAKDKEGYDQIMYQANFSPDGRLLVTANQDGKMRVYRSDTGEKLIDVSAVAPGDKPAALRSAFFSHNGRRILTAGEAGTVAVWDADSGQALMKLAGARGHSDILYSAVFSPNDELIATASRDGTIRILDARSGELVGKPLTVKPPRPFRSGVFSPRDGKLILGAGESAQLWNASTGKTVGEIKGHRELLRWAAFSNDGKLIATASNDHKARIYVTDDVLRGKGDPKAQFATHGASVNSVEFSPDNQFLLSSSADNTARIWTIEPKVHRFQPLEHDASVRSVAFSPDGRLVATASEDGTAAVWDAASGARRDLAFPDSKRGWITSIAFDRDGDRVVASGTDKVVRIWDAQSGRLLRELRGHAGWIYSAAFSPDGLLVGTASEDGTEMIWRVNDGARLATCRAHLGRVTGIAFDPTSNGSRFATAGEDGSTKIWNWNSTGCMAIRSIETHHGWAYSVAFSSDGRRLASAGKDGVVRTWDSGSGKLIRELRGHVGWIYRVAWQGDRIITACKDGTARTWDPESGQQVSVIPGKAGRWVYSAEISRGGDKVALASEGGEVSVYGSEFLSPIGDLATVVDRLRKLTPLEQETYLHQAPNPAH